MSRLNRIVSGTTVLLGSLLLLLACGPAPDQDLSPLATSDGTAAATPAGPTDTAEPVVGTPAATTQAEQTDTPAPGASQVPTATDARQARLTPTITDLPELAPAVTETPVTGEVPRELLTAIIADLAARQRATPADIAIVRAEAVTWNDGSLGCPEPGMSYIQVLVDGYWVVLEHEGQEFDYRATNQGYFRLCTSPPPGNH